MTKLSFSLVTSVAALVFGLSAAPDLAHAQKNSKNAKSQGPGDKILTRDELRACFKENDRLTAERKRIEQERAEVDAQRADVVKQREVVQADFEKTREELRVEREKTDTTSADAVAAFNAKAAAAQKRYEDAKRDNDTKIDAWNKRNSESLAHDRQFNEAHEKWKADCSNRRFREDDEKAIRAGK